MSYAVVSTFLGMLRRRRSVLRSYAVLSRACLITLHSNFEIFQKGHPAVEVMLDRRIFER